MGIMVSMRASLAVLVESSSGYRHLDGGTQWVKTPTPLLKLQFDRRVCLEFRGATITSDAGLLACREFDDALELTETATACLQGSRGGRNIQHQLVSLLRQSVYSRIAGYEDTKDAQRPAHDPAIRVIVGRRGPERQAASTNAVAGSRRRRLPKGTTWKGWPV